MHPDMNRHETPAPFAARSSKGRKKKFCALVLTFLLIAAFSGWANVCLDESRSGQILVGIASAQEEAPEKTGSTSEGNHVGDRKILYYVSPMDPEFKSDKPGKAPCGMDLVPVYEDENPSAKAAPPEMKDGRTASPVQQSPTKAAVASDAKPEDKTERERKILYYVDPMNPTQKSDKPGKAPCGMDLVPVYDEEDMSGNALPLGTIRISPQKQQLIGIKTGEVSEQSLSKTLRTVGRVAIDETRIIHVHSKYPGWIKKVYVDFAGKQVEKGQPLVSISSSDFVSSQEELLIAKKSMDALRASSIEGVGARAASFYESSKRRLQLKDVSDDQIREIEEQNTAMELLTLHSSINGLVLSRHAFEGQHVSPDMELYTLADASSIWVMADIYEYEMEMVRQGQPVTVTLPYLPGRTFEGAINYIYPKLDPKSRTLKVRIELANPELQLKPDMYANVNIDIDYGKRLSVQREAVLNSGGAHTVFIAREDGYFEPRKVKLGQQVNDFHVVLDGLKAGERVVISANFLIDSESQIKTAIGGMAGDMDQN